MKLTKKRKKLWTILVTIAGIGLILTSMLPFLYSIF